MKHIEVILGTALLIGAAAMVLRYVLDRRAREARGDLIHEITPRPLVTVLIGVVGGVIVGMTSVGAGSLMVILLLFVYPRISAKQLVGTDLTQAVPLTLSAAVGALIFGHVQFGLTGSLIIGSVPAVFIGSLLSSSVPDRYIRPVIAFVILASGLKYVGLGTSAARVDPVRPAARRRRRRHLRVAPRFQARRRQSGRPGGLGLAGPLRIQRHARGSVCRYVDLPERVPRDPPRSRLHLRAHRRSDRPPGARRPVPHAPHDRSQDRVRPAPTRSSTPRTASRYIVVASKGGDPKAPAWLLNLRAKPAVEVQIGRKRFPAVATEIGPSEPDYARLWKLVNDENAGRYDGYQKKTTRPIPLVALTRGV